MARRENKPKVRSLYDIVNEVNNSEEYGYKQLRERLAVEREAEIASAAEEGEPQGFLSSAPSNLEVTATMQAAPEESWGEGVGRAGYEAIANLFGGTGYGEEDNRPLIQRAGGGIEKLVSAVLPDAIERGMNLGQANIAMAMPEGQVMDTTTGRMRSDRVERMGVAAQEREQADNFQASRSTQDAMRAMSEADGVGGWLGAATPAAVGQMLGESVGQQLPQMAITAGSAGLGLPLMAASTYNAEFQGEIEKAAQEDGVDINDARRFDSWMRNNPDKVKSAEEKGRTRGTIIAGVDLISFGAGSAIAKAVDNTGLKRAAFLAGANLVADVGGGAGGEAAAQLATDGKIKVGEVLNEGFAGLPLTLTQTPGQIAEGVRRGRDIEQQESSRFNTQLDRAVIEQGNAQLEAARAEEDARIQAEIDRENQQALVDAQNRRLEEGANWVQNAEQQDMFGADENVVGTFEEQEALRQYEMEQRALSLQERRRAFEAMERSRAVDEANYDEIVEGSRQAQFDARDAEQAQVRQSQEALDPAFNPPQESQMAEQLRLALANRGVAPAVAEEVMEEVSAPEVSPPKSKYEVVDFGTTPEGGLTYTRRRTADGELATFVVSGGGGSSAPGSDIGGSQPFVPKSDANRAVVEDLITTHTKLGSLSDETYQEFKGALASVVKADKAGEPAPKSALAVLEKFKARVEENDAYNPHWQSMSKEERADFLGDIHPVLKGMLSKADTLTGISDGNMLSIRNAYKRVYGDVVPATEDKAAAPAATAEVAQPQPSSEEQAAPERNFIGPVRGRRTEANVGENRTTRVDERDPLPFPEMARTDGVVQEPTAVVEDVAPEQMELEGMDVAQPTDTVRGTLDAARKKREEKQKKDKAEALKKAKAKHTSDRNKFLEELLERNLTPAREEAALAEWMESNPVPTEATVTVAPAAKPVAVPDATAVADKAVQSAAKNRVAAWRRGRTVAANRAMAEAKARKLKDDEARKLVTQRVEEYDNRNPNPESTAPSQAAPTQQAPATKVEPNDPRVDEQLAAIRLFDTSTPEAELRADIAAELSAINLDQDMNPVPEDKRATIEDVRALLGVPSSGNARSARRAIGNGIVQLVTEATMGNYRSDINQTTQAWYDGEKMYVIVDRLNKDNLMGEIMGAIAHEGKHASDASGKGAKGIGHFIGVEANRRLRTRIEEAASRGDQAAVRAVARATAAAKKRPGLPGLYEVELPAYYITEIADRPTTLYRGLVSSIRVGVNNLLGRKDVNVDDIAYMADRMVENLSYDSYAIGSIQRLLDKQGGVTIGSLTEQVEGLDQGMYGGRTEAIATTPNGSFNLVDDVAPEGTDYSEFGQVRKVTAYEDGKEVGTLVYANDGTPPTIEVAETHRRRGVGTAMLKMAREQGGVLGEGSSGIRGRGSEYRTSDGQAFRSNANENNAQLDYVTALNQDMDDLSMPDRQSAVLSITRSNPLYRGNRDNNPTPRSSDGALGPGYYYTSDRGAAESYGSVVTHHDLSEFRRPLVITMREVEAAEGNTAAAIAADKAFADENFNTRGGAIRWAREEWEQWSGIGDTDFPAMLRDAGYDSVVLVDNGVIVEMATPRRASTYSLDQDAEELGTSRFSPKPNEVLSRSAAERVARTTGTFVRNMLDPNGGLGSEVNNYLQDSVGEAAHYAAEAQKSAWELKRGIAEHAAKNKKTVDEVNAEIGKRMEALATIGSPVRREAALSNYVQANPELAPLLEGYRTIAAFSNKVADNVMARRPLTEADRKFAQNLRDSAFAYTTRIYTSRQGEAGKSISRKMLRTAAKAKTKLEQGKTLTKQEQEAFTRYDDAANYLMERLTIPPIEDLVGMRQSRINELFDTWADQDAARFREAAYDDAIRNGMDEESAKIAAKESMVEVLDGLRDLSQVERILNDKADMVIRSLLGLNASSPTASTVGGLREDRGILQKREDLAPELRRLMGEVVADPAVMLSVTMAKQGELIARENFLRKLADTGMVTSQDLAGTGPFSEHTVKLRGDTAGSLKDMYTTPEVARVVNAQLEMYSTVTDAAAISFMQSDAMAAALARRGVNAAAWLASKAKMSSVVLSPFAMAMNAAGSALMLLPNGVYSPGMMVDAMTAAKDSVLNTLGEGSNYSDVLANAVRWNVIDSARLQELRRSVHDSLKDTVVNPSVQSKAWHKAKLGFGATTEVFAMTDSWTKIAAFIKQQDYLTKFYQAEGVKKTADEISSEAAAIVRNTNFTYSKVPPVIRNVFERTGLTMFATYFWSVPLAITGNYQQAFNDVMRASKATTAKGRHEATTMAISRFMGTNAAVAVVPILGQMLAQSLNEMGDEDEDKIKAMAGMLRDEQPYADPIYLGKDKEGKPLFFLFNRLDPYGPVTDLVRILGNKELENDKKYDAMKSLFMGMWFKNSAIVEAGKVLTSEERGNTSTRLERIPFIGAATREMQGVVGYADWARSLTTLVDRAFVPAFVNVLDPENPTVSDDYNSNMAAVLGMMTYASGGKAVKADPESALRTIGFELKEAKDSARKRVAQAISNGDSPERIADMIMTESDDMFYDFERAQRTYEGMVNGLGMSPRAAAAILKSREGAGMNDVQIGLIRRGLLRGDKEMALELAGILSKKSVEDRVARTRGYKEDKDQAVSDAQEALKILRRDYGLKVGE